LFIALIEVFARALHSESSALSNNDNMNDSYGVTSNREAEEN